MTSPAHSAVPDCRRNVEQAIRKHRARAQQPFPLGDCGDQMCPHELVETLALGAGQKEIRVDLWRTAETLQCELLENGIPVAWQRTNLFFPDGPHRLSLNMLPVDVDTPHLFQPMRFSQIGSCARCGRPESYRSHGGQ